MASCSCFTLFLSSFLSLLFLMSAATNTVKLPLYPCTHHDSESSNPYRILGRLAAASLARARHIKHPKPDAKTEATATAVKFPLFPHSYGGYSVSLSFGTPPQTTPFLFDTGSSLVWFPCTSRYLCSKCDFYNIDPDNVPRFMPKNSSSSKIIGCKNTKCQWLLGSNVQCGECHTKTRICTDTCPPYVIQYGSGSTAGILLSETLDFPNRSVPDFLVGCSFLSNQQPAGIAGFGRGPESLPSQLGLRKFSYCLVSRRFDDSSVSSDLFLETGSDSPDGSKILGLSYTPLRKNPNVAFQEYYYVNLRRIFVKDKRVNIPYRFLEPGPDGNGGSIVDSGSTFTFMERPAFDLVAKEFETQMGNYSRATDIEKLAGLRPCFKISEEKSVTVPELVFQFKGGAKMKLPLSNYFSFVGSRDVVCLTIVSDNVADPVGGGQGPGIILGSFQQQNYYVEYDLEEERLGFVKKSCN